MGELTIDEIDDELMEARQRQADRNARTVEEEVAAMIMAAIGRVPLDKPATVPSPDPTTENRSQR